MRDDPWDYSELYDQWSEGYREDLAYYREVASKAAETGLPILELCCGTGRLLPVLLQDGAKVIGLDVSASQLAVAAHKPELHKAQMEGRLHLVQGEMSRFHFATRFSAIILAFNSFCYLLDDISRRRCLLRARRQLVPGGVLAMDTDNAQAKAPGAEGKFLLDETVADCPEPGSETNVYIAYRRHRSDPRIENVRYRFEVIGEGTNEAMEAHHDMRCDRPQAVLRQLRAAGFGSIDLRGNFVGAPFEAASSPLVVVHAYSAAR